MLEIRLLGQFDVRLNGVTVDIPSRPAQSLLARLVLTAGVAHRREKLAGELWPDAIETNARSNLRHALWRIRKALEGARHSHGKYIIADGISIAFNARSDFWLDARVVEQQLKHPQPSTDALMVAASLYQGELLPGLYDEWTNPYRVQMQITLDCLMKRLLTHLREEGRWHEAIEMTGHWIARGESQETAYRELMIAHCALGDLASMQFDFRALRSQLQRQYDMLPSDETCLLFEQLLATSRAQSQLHRRAADVILFDPKMPIPSYLTSETSVAAQKHFLHGTTTAIGAKNGLSAIAGLPADRHWRSTAMLGYERVAIPA